MSDINKIFSILLEEINNKLLDEEGAYVAIGGIEDRLKLFNEINTKLFSNCTSYSSTDFSAIEVFSTCRYTKIVFNFLHKTTWCIITDNTQLRGFKHFGERPVVMITDTADPSLLYRYPIVLRKEKTRLYSLASEEEKEKQWLKYK